VSGKAHVLPESLDIWDPSALLTDAVESVDLANFHIHAAKLACPIGCKSGIPQCMEDLVKMN